MSYTPGPWSVFGERPTPRNCGIDADTVPFSIVVWGNAGDEDQGVQGRTRDEMLANARLIAAAPDLLETAKAIIEIYGPPTEYSHEARVAWEALSAAIAKAEGQ